MYYAHWKVSITRKELSKIIINSLFLDTACHQVSIACCSVVIIVKIMSLISQILDNFNQSFSTMKDDRLD